MADPPYQSLYRRYRPQRFDEVRGQEHVTTALRNAVAADRTTHAYLFSGPRGTGKTSTARILAAALNCTEREGGEPCGSCASCRSVRSGASLDVVELDAASNNGVDAMRDLVGRAALGSPGRWKVYIVDEVHMLSTAASNALLKTLEEPPAHVVFVLATTDPQKVLPTIRSRTQHYEFRLLGPDLLAGLLTDVNDRAHLGLDPDTLERVVRRGNGSARDALSALDQAAAAGGADDDTELVPAIVEALAGRDAGAALVAVAEAASRGRDPQRVAVETVEHLRSAFLLSMAPELAGVPEQQRPVLEEQGRRLGPAATVRAMEVLGETLVAMRDALDARVTLELALVRLCAPRADTSPAALLERLERLERRLADGPGAEAITRPQGGSAPAHQAAPASPPPRAGAPEPTRSAPPPPQPPPGPSPTSPPDRAAAPPPIPRPTIGAMRRQPPASGGALGGARSAAPARPRPGGPAPAPGPAGPGPAQVDGPPPDRDELTKLWGDSVLAELPNAARSIYKHGRWRSVEDGVAVFTLPNPMFRDRAEEHRAEVESALAARYGRRVRVRVEAEAEQAGSPIGAPTGADAAPVDAPPDEDVSAEEFARLEPAPDAPSSAEAKLLQAFPGSEQVGG